MYEEEVGEGRVGTKVNMHTVYFGMENIQCISFKDIHPDWMDFFLKSILGKFLFSSLCPGCLCHYSGVGLAVAAC